MPKFLDIENWNRREHYKFFRHFDEPLYGISTEVDCTRTYEKAKLNAHSFFLSYLHKSLIAANQTEEFRYRIDGEAVIIFDEIHASPTVGRDDGTFGYSFFPFHPDFQEFTRDANKAIQHIQETPGLNLNKNEQRLDVIHFSSLPWFHFTGLSHPRVLNNRDNVPKITFGGWIERDGKKMMPVAVHAHHGLVDGYHIGQFLNTFQALLNE